MLSLKCCCCYHLVLILSAGGMDLAELAAKLENLDQSNQTEEAGSNAEGLDAIRGEDRWQ